MPHPTRPILFFAAAFQLAVMPGPGILYVASRTLAGGRAEEGVASTFGTGTGGMLHVFEGSLGVSTIVLASAELFAALKLVGAAWLIWLGIRTVLAARRDASAMVSRGFVAPAVGARRAFRDGVLVEALNPKTAAFFLSFIPQFVDPAAGHVALQFVALGFVSVGLNTLADVATAFAASAVRAGVASRQR
jgi:threonine/homoserine/homoserine lactone efflux protein